MPQSEHLTHSPARITRRLLIDLGLVTESGNWPCFVGAEPDAPDQCVTVYTSPDGVSDGRSMIDGEPWEHPAVQVRVRAASELAGHEKASAIREALAAVHRRPVATEGTGYVVQCYSRIGTVTDLGYGPSGGKRRIFTISATLSVWRVT